MANEASSTGGRAHVLIAVISTLLPLISAVFGLRLYTRLRLVKAIGLDDWVIFLALLSVLATGIVMAVMTMNGLGQHVSTLSPETIENYLYGFYFSIVFYYISLGLIKLGIILQYYHLVALKARKFMFLTAILISAWSISLVVVQVFTCDPISGFWRQDVEASCIPSLPLWYINAGGNIATDVVLFALPIPIVWKLQMPRTQRLSLLGVFGLGFFTCTISIIRIEFLNNGTDFTFNNIAPAGWSLGELCAGITCACLPTLRPLIFRVVSPKLNSFSLSRRKNSMANILRAGSVLKSKTGSVSEPAKDGTVQILERSLATVDEESGQRDGEQRSSCGGSDDGQLVSEDRSQVFRNVM